MSLVIQARFSAAQTSLGYQFYDEEGTLLGSRVTAGIDALPETGGYIAVVATVPTGAVGVYWDSTESEASEDLREALAIAGLENISTGDIRTELATELGRIDAAVSTRATDAGSATAVWAAGTRTLTGFGTLIADIWANATRTLSAFAFTPTPSNAADTTAIKAKTDNLPADPAGEASITALDAKIGTPAVTIAADIAAIDGGGGGSGLSSETIAALEAAAQVLLVELHTPSEAPSVIIPAPSDDETLCVVYAYTENILSAKRAGVVVALSLVTTPAKTERILESATVSDQTDANGYVAISVRRGHTYRVVSTELDLDDELTIGALDETFDLSTLIA